MKKWIGSILILMLVLSLAGCGAKEKIKDKAGEALGEKVIEDTGAGDVDIDGDKVHIKSESGEELTLGETEWPKSELAKNVPEFTGGKVTAVFDSDDCVIVTLGSVKETDAAAYFDSIKKKFIKEPVELNAEGTFSYGAKNADGIGVTLLYSEESLTVTITKPAQ